MAVVLTYDGRTQGLDKIPFFPVLFPRLCPCPCLLAGSFLQTLPALQQKTNKLLYHVAEQAGYSFEYVCRSPPITVAEAEGKADVHHALHTVSDVKVRQGVPVATVHHNPENTVNLALIFPVVRIRYCVAASAKLYAAVSGFEHRFW